MLYVYTEEQRQQRLKDMNSDWLMKILQDPSQPAMLLMPVCVFCQIVAVTMTLLQVFLDIQKSKDRRTTTVKCQKIISV